MDYSKIKTYHRPPHRPIRSKRNYTKIIIAAILLAIIIVAASASAMSNESSRTKTPETAKTVNVTTTKKEPVKSTENKPVETPAVAEPVPTPEPTPAPVIDPNNCEAQGMHYRADNNACIPKPTPVVEAPSKAVYSPSTIQSTAGVEQWRGLVSQYFGSETDYALRIMQCESGGNTAAHSPTNDFGLMQVNSVHAAKVGGDLNVLYDPATNIKIAKQIRDGSGWSAWSCSRKI